MARGEWKETTYLIGRMVEVWTKEWPATVRHGIVP